MKESWKKLLDKDKLNKIRDYLSGTSFQPKFKDIFNCFRYFEIEDTKAVFLFLTPYKTDQATGLATAVSYGDRPTLSIMRDALANDLCHPMLEEHFDNTLEHWAKQGILLLNISLTVPCNGGARDHIKLWSWFTKRVIEELDKQDVLFVLFGKDAQGYELFIKNNKVIKSIHPAATYYSLVKNNFDDSKIPEELDFRKHGIFNKISKILKDGYLHNHKWIETN